MTRGVLVAFIAWAGSFHPPIAAQDASSYRLIVETYRKGEFVAAVTAVRKLPSQEIDREVKLLVEAERAVGRRSPTETRRQRVSLQAALLLHSETIIVLGAEATRASAEERAVHEKAQLQLLGALEAPSPARPTPEEEKTGGEAFLQAWYLLMIAEAQNRLQLIPSRNFAMRARKQLGDYPELLLAIGALNEVAWLLQHEQQPMFGFNGDLKEAEAAYRGALAGNARLDEARVRLGRVLTWRNDLDEALRTFAALRAETPEPGFLYLARLFEGDALERRGDSGGAAESYAAAIEALPSGQAARVALAHVRHAGGDRADAFERVSRLAGETTNAHDTTDPWWWYQRGVAWRAQGYLEWLRRMVKQ